MCTRHALCPSESWNHPPGHGKHALASSTAAKRPAAQFSHTRSALAVAAAVSRVPLRQRCTLRHTVCPAVDWYCPLAHASHDVLALAFWIWPAAHSWQYSAAARFTAPEPKRPGSHASQKNAFASPLCLPAGHALHSTAFSCAEYCPAAHSLHAPAPSA